MSCSAQDIRGDYFKFAVQLHHVTRKKGGALFKYEGRVGVVEVIRSCNRKKLKEIAAALRMYEQRSMKFEDYRDTEKYENIRRSILQKLRTRIRESRASSGSGRASEHAQRRSEATNAPVSFTDRNEQGRVDYPHPVDEI